MINRGLGQYHRCDQCHGTGRARSERHGGTVIHAACPRCYATGWRIYAPEEK